MLLDVKRVVQVLPYLPFASLDYLILYQHVSPEMPKPRLKRETLRRRSSSQRPRTIAMVRDLEYINAVILRNVFHEVLLLD